MNTEMNNNNSKKHSKTLATAGMGFLLIAAAFSFSFASSGQQFVSAQEQQQQQEVQVAIPFDTFTASGMITGSIQEQGGEQQQQAGGQNQTQAGGQNQTQAGGQNQTNATMGQTMTGGAQPGPYILGGEWNLNVQDGNVTGFGANFIMVRTDGTEYHDHDIRNFMIGNNTVTLIRGQELSINGSADISVNGTTQWPGVDTTLTLSPNAAVLTINPSPEGTTDHFQGQPIYGIVEQATGENGTAIIQPPPGRQQAQQQQEEEGNGGPLEALTGGDDQQQQQQQQGGNQTDGDDGILGGIGDFLTGGG